MRKKRFQVSNVIGKVDAWETTELEGRTLAMGFQRD